MKSKGTAYLLWLLSIFGCLGFHRFYLGKIGTGLLWMITGGLCGIGALIDLFTLGGSVDQYNTNKELKQMREVTMANAMSTSAVASAVASNVAANTAKEQ